MYPVSKYIRHLCNCVVSSVLPPAQSRGGRGMSEART